MTTTWPNILISAFTESNNELSASSAAVELHYRRQLTKHTQLRNRFTGAIHEGESTHP